MDKPCFALIPAPDGSALDWVYCPEPAIALVKRDGRTYCAAHATTAATSTTRPLGGQ